VWLPWTKYPAGASPSVEPYRHGLVKAQDPPGDKLLHVRIPRTHHLPNLPKLITEGGRLLTREDKGRRDGNESRLRHDGAKIVGTGPVLLRPLDAAVVPELARRPPLNRCH
jgi:hypothetical protein